VSKPWIQSGPTAGHTGPAPAPRQPIEASTAAAPDAVELEIFRYAGESIVNELDVNTQRTAQSPIIYEFKDYCWGILTDDYRLLTQSRHNLPLFIADLGPPVQDVVDLLGEGRVEPGDIFITNFNPPSGSHLNHIVMATPLYLEGRLAGYIAGRLQWIDVGGLQPGSVSGKARHILHEGVQYRGLKVVSRGMVVPEVVATIQANTWLPGPVTGDLMAYIASCTLGVRRWEERIASRWSAEAFDALCNAQFAASTAIARAKVASLPNGMYSASCEMDEFFGLPGFRLSVAIEVKGSKMVVDLSDLPPQVEVPINSGTSGGATSSIRVGFVSLLAPDRPVDEGLFEPLEIVIPEGTIMSARDGAPMSFWQQIPPTMIDLFLRAFGEQLPELVPAGNFDDLGGLVIVGNDPVRGRWLYQAAGYGGSGASAVADGSGPIGVLALGDNPMIPAEQREGRYPLRVHALRSLPSYGGRGLHRGGPGLEQTVELLAPASITSMINRTRTPAWGLAGGEPGRSGEVHIRLPGSKRWKKVGWLTEVELPTGTLIRKRNGGGGGWGERPRQQRKVRARSVAAAGVRGDGEGVA
jgi:N-methylhydantoinase B